MDFTDTQEQRAIRDSVARICAHLFCRAATREVREHGAICLSKSY